MLFINYATISSLEAGSGLTFPSCSDSQVACFDFAPNAFLPLVWARLVPSRGPLCGLAKSSVGAPEEQE